MAPQLCSFLLAVCGPYSVHTRRIKIHFKFYQTLQPSLGFFAGQFLTNPMKYVSKQFKLGLQVQNLAFKPIAINKVNVLTQSKEGAKDALNFSNLYNSQSL